MNRLLSSLLVLVALCGSACAADKILIAQVPQSVYDLTREPATKLGASAVNSTVGDANAAVWKAAQDSLGYDTTGTRIYKPLFIPGGRWPMGQIKIGVNAAGTAARSGGRLCTGGGLGPGLNENASATTWGNTTRLLYTAGKSSNEAFITYNGYGWILDPMELCGIRLVTGADYTNRDAITKTPIGLLITSLDTAGVPNGKLIAPAVFYQGFGTAIKIYQSGSSGNNDNNTFGFIDLDACDIGIDIESSQSVTTLIDKIHTHFYVDKILKVGSGGDVHIGSVQVNCPNVTVCEIGAGYTTDSGTIEVDNVRLDNSADSPVILTMSAYAGVPRFVKITGSVAAGVTYTTANLVQGEDPAHDRVQIIFNGSTQAMTDFNGQSTCDANWELLP